jgi:hypothetical protein
MDVRVHNIVSVVETIMVTTATVRLQLEHSKSLTKMALGIFVLYLWRKVQMT